MWENLQIFLPLNKSNTNLNSMKQIFLTAILTTLLGSFAISQNFVLTTLDGVTLQQGDTVTVVSTQQNVIYSTIVWITNNSLTSKYIKVRKTPMSIVQGSDNYFCWGNCYDTSVYVSIDSIEMTSKETEKQFSGDYASNDNAGSTVIKYTFYDVANPSDNIYFFIEFIAGSGVGIKNGASEYNISNAFPNPSNGTFNISYNISGAKKARVEIINIIGSVVSSQEISTQSKSASLDISYLNNGVYFYNVIVDDVKIESKRLIIQR